MVRCGEARWGKVRLSVDNVHSLRVYIDEQIRRQGELKMGKLDTEKTEMNYRAMQIINWILQKQGNIGVSAEQDLDNCYKYYTSKGTSQYAYSLVVARNVKNYCVAISILKKLQSFREKKQKLLYCYITDTSRKKIFKISVANVKSTDIDRNNCEDVDNLSDDAVSYIETGNPHLGEILNVEINGTEPKTIQDDYKVADFPRLYNAKKVAPVVFKEQRIDIFQTPDERQFASFPHIVWGIGYNRRKIDTDFILTKAANGYFYSVPKTRSGREVVNTAALPEILEKFINWRGKKKPNQNHIKLAKELKTFWETEVLKTTTPKSLVEPQKTKNAFEGAFENSEIPVQGTLSDSFDLPPVESIFKGSGSQYFSEKDLEDVKKVFAGMSNIKFSKETFKLAVSAVATSKGKNHSTIIKLLDTYDSYSFKN